MNENAEQQLPTAAPSYARAELARAFTTALTHEDRVTRDRAVARVARWRAVLSGMANGQLRIGSRTPVAGLPAWITPEVVRGGFATGQPAAGGPLLPHEAAAAERAGVPGDRRALFAHFLTEPGLTELWDLLDSGRYAVALPEEAALLTVAWLVRAGETDAALALVGELEPFADRVRLLPRPSDTPAPDAHAVHRATADDAGWTLSLRGPNSRVETQRESLAVWAPFADDLLAHWLEVREPDGTPRPATGRPGAPAAAYDGAYDADWLARGQALLRRYRRLAEEHTLCAKHRRPRENAAILRTALEEVVAGRPPAARLEGLLRHAVASMVGKRGVPGSAPHAALRHEQARLAALPAHHRLAQLVVVRLSGLPQDTGVADTAPLLVPVTAREAEATGLPAGAEIPPSVRAAVESALSAPLAALVARGVVPSAEVLAELVPQLVAATTADAYRDPALRILMAAAHRSFRNRRSLLLLHLERQVRVEELPWVRAVASHRSGDEAVAEAARAALRELGTLAVQAFPATLLPNPLVREMSVLGRQADIGVPFTEELAADIFMGEFGPKFLVAARVAAELLRGTLYERYYGIDYAAVRNLAITEAGQAAGRSYPARTSPGFGRLCAERAGGGRGSVAANGTVIEQAQILTTHNLATLVGRVGITPEPGFADLAVRCFDAVCRLTARVHGRARPLATIKDAAYAWRQMVFHLSLCTDAERAAVLDGLARQTDRYPAHVAARLAPALAGLRLTAAGGAFGRDGTADGGRARRLVGWTTGRHWMGDEPPAAHRIGSRA
ncbi:hypothetical protein [Streptomyces sp. t39]|uniref:hypothetical protein n=1 Tax=Streptomyces sp. t39 TaxID=1828156 RepID=UPI0011CE3AD4|nr:hypothetical protein [Streptomyces sp. t39]TXS56532.1 hypothetical protein EAO77_10710 [Streptomyces sp. t39]